MADLVLDWDGAPGLNWYGALGVDRLCMLNCGGALRLKLCMLAWCGANGVVEAVLAYDGAFVLLLVYKQEIHKH